MPAITASPTRPTSAKSNAGTITSPLSGEPGETVGGSAVARAADSPLQHPLSVPPPLPWSLLWFQLMAAFCTGCRKQVPHQMLRLTRAAEGYRAIDMGVMMRTVGQIVGSPSTPLKIHRALISAGNQVHVPGCCVGQHCRRGSGYAKLGVVPVFSTVPRRLYRNEDAPCRTQRPEPTTVVEAMPSTIEPAYVSARSLRWNSY